MAPCRLVLLLSLAVPLAFGQQTGDANRNYTIGGVGAGGTTPVISSLGVPAPLVNAFATTEPEAPIFWLASGAMNPGQLVTPFNSADLGTAPSFFDLVVLGTGVAPGVLGQFFQTDLSGTWELTLTAPVALAPGSINLACVVLTAANSDAVWVSQTHVLSFSLDPNLALGNPTCNPAALPVTLTDDSFIQQTLTGPLSIPFYGTSYTTLFIGSNGYVTFNTGQTTLGESAAGLLSGPPRISMWWDDLNPATGGGTVSFFTDNLNVVEVCFSNVPEFSIGGSNSFKLTLIISPGSTTLMTMDFGSMGAIDGLTGLAAGGNLGTLLPLNLSVGPNVLQPTDAPYELFTTTNPNDLAGYQLNWLLDPAGNPTLQF